jgi:hypothetical protein
VGEAAQLFYIRGGEVMRIVHYFDHERALPDFDLPSEAGSSPS